MTGRFHWPEATVKKMLEMVEAGHPSSVIAEAIGTSRSAVCGRLHRMGVRLTTRLAEKRYASLIVRPGKKSGRKTAPKTEKALSTAVTMLRQGYSRRDILATLDYGGRYARTILNRAIAQTGIVPEKVARQTIPDAEGTPTGWPKPAGPNAVRFASVKNSHTRNCQMPLWDDATPIEARLVCGEPVVPGKSWCAACYRLVYQPRLPNARAA